MRMKHVVISSLIGLTLMLALALACQFFAIVETPATVATGSMLSKAPDLPQTYTVTRPVRETCTKDVAYTVMRPIREERSKTVSYTVMTVVRENRTKIDPITGDKITYTIARHVPEQREKVVEYFVTNMVPEQKRKTIEYQTVRFETAQVPR